jgi:iron(III) transport system permease protein
VTRAAAAARRHRLPLLAVPAVATAAAVLLPLAYLAIRAGGDAGAWAILGRSQTLELVLGTAGLVASVTACSVAIGVPLAWLVVRTDLPGRRVWAVLAALPLVIPSYVAALALLGAFGPRGMLQRALGAAFGVERLPEIYGFPGALLALTLSTYPYVFLLVAAALRTLDPSLEEAARSLGRSPLRTFARTTVPALRPSIAAGALLVALYALSDFGAVSLMQYDALTRAIYLRYRTLLEREPAAVLALVLVALTILVLVLESRFRGRARYFRVAPGAGRAPRRVRLGRWRWGALAFCALVVGGFLLVPVGVLAYWLVRALALGRDTAFAWDAGLNSLVAAALAGVLALAAALPVALLGRRRRWWTRTLERACYTSNALPGIVLALSLVYFAARYGGGLYQTLPVLLFAYVVRFLPQALAGASSAFEAVSPRLEEAARGLGRSPAAAFAATTAVLARPGLLAGGALVFLSAMKELPATLLLRPIGFETLATEVWKYTSLGFYSQASAPALALVVLSAPVVYLLLERGAPAPDAPG